MANQNRAQEIISQLVGEHLSVLREQKEEGKEEKEGCAGFFRLLAIVSQTWLANTQRIDGHL